MTLHLHARGTFDEEREMRVACHCARRITGRCWATSAAGCPFDRFDRARPRPVGRWGIVWACPDRGEGSE